MTPICRLKPLNELATAQARHDLVRADRETTDGPIRRGRARGLALREQCSQGRLSTFANGSRVNGPAHCKAAQG